MRTGRRPVIEDIDALGSGHENGRTIDMCTDHRPSIEDIDVIGSGVADDRTIGMCFRRSTELSAALVL